MAFIPEPRRRLFQLVVLALIALAALLLRVYYVHTAIVFLPIRGDAIQYRAYTWNLIHHHIFSSALPHATSVVADGFRDPGYPVFLAAIAGSGDMQDTFVQRVMDAQAILSTATAWVFMVLARRWAGFITACVTGVLLTFWPHLITMSGYVLSETLTGFLVALALLLTDTLIRRGGKAYVFASALSWAAAALTNAILTPFVPLLAIWQWRRSRHSRIWATFLVVTLAPLLAWSLRSALLPSAGQESAGDRARMNLVQGSWPEYHDAAWVAGMGNPQADAILQSIADEYALIRSDMGAGITQMVARMGREPARYMGWYLSKPLELWGWDIGIGEGDIYVYPTFRSPLTMQPTLRGLVNVLFFLSPFLMLLAAAGAVLAFVPAMESAPGLRIAVALGLWVTLVYGVLQSDARYATPFRGIEIFLAVYALHTAAVVLLRRRKSLFANGRITS